MKCSIKLKSFNHLILDDVLQLCVEEAKKNNLEKASIIRLPKKIKKFSLIKSPHVHKKSREQFEIIYYNRLLFLKGSYEKLKGLIHKLIINNKHTLYYKINWRK